MPAHLKSRGAHFIVFKLPAIAYMAFIFFMSSGPVTSETLNSVPDYFLHALGFSVLSVLTFWAVHEGLDKLDGAGGFWLPILITVLYGISDEFHQSFVPSRDAELTDIVSDAAGALLGILFVILIRRLISCFRRARPA